MTKFLLSALKGIFVACIYSGAVWFGLDRFGIDALGVGSGVVIGAFVYYVFTRDDAIKDETAGSIAAVLVFFATWLLINHWHHGGHRVL